MEIWGGKRRKYTINMRERYHMEWIYQGPAKKPCENYQGWIVDNNFKEKISHYLIRLGCQAYFSMYIYNKS